MNFFYLRKNQMFHDFQTLVCIIKTCKSSSSIYHFSSVVSQTTHPTILQEIEIMTFYFLRTSKKKFYNLDY